MRKAWLIFAPFWAFVLWNLVYGTVYRVRALHAAEIDQNLHFTFIFINILNWLIFGVILLVVQFVSLWVAQKFVRIINSRRS